VLGYYFVLMVWSQLGDREHPVRAGRERGSQGTRESRGGGFYCGEQCDTAATSSDVGQVFDAMAARD